MLNARECLQCRHAIETPVGARNFQQLGLGGDHLVFVWVRLVAARMTAGFNNLVDIQQASIKTAVNSPTRIANTAPDQLEPPSLLDQRVDSFREIDETIYWTSSLAK